MILQMKKLFLKHGLTYHLIHLLETEDEDSSCIKSFTLPRFRQVLVLFRGTISSKGFRVKCTLKTINQAVILAVGVAL